MHHSLIDIIKGLLYVCVILFIIIIASIKFRKKHMSEYKNAIAQVKTEKATLISKAKEVLTQTEDTNGGFKYEGSIMESVVTTVLPQSKEISHYLKNPDAVFDNLLPAEINNHLNNDICYLTFKSELGYYHKLKASMAEYEKYSEGDTGFITYKGDRLVCFSDNANDLDQRKLTQIEIADSNVKQFYDEMPEDNKTGYIIKAAFCYILLAVAIISIFVAIINNRMALFSAGLFVLCLGTLFIFARSPGELSEYDNVPQGVKTLPIVLGAWVIGLYLTIQGYINCWGSESNQKWFNDNLVEIIIGIPIIVIIPILICKLLKNKRK